ELLRTVEIAVGACRAAAAGAASADRELWMRPCGGGERRLNRAEFLRRSRAQKRRVTAVRRANRDARAEHVAHARANVRDRRTNGGVADDQRIAVHVAVVELRNPARVVLVEHPVAAGRLAGGARLQRLVTGDGERADRRDDEDKPERDRAPGMGAAPT